MSAGVAPGIEASSDGVHPILKPMTSRIGWLTPGRPWMTSRCRSRPTCVAHRVHRGGALLELITRRTTLLDVFTRLSRDFGDVGYVPLAGEHLYVLSDPGLIWQGFVAEARNTRKSRGLALTRPLLGTGLLNSEGADHLQPPTGAAGVPSTTHCGIRHRHGCCD